MRKCSTFEKKEKKTTGEREENGRADITQNGKEKKHCPKWEERDLILFAELCANFEYNGISFSFFVWFEFAVVFSNDFFHIQSLMTRVTIVYLW